MSSVQPVKTQRAHPLTASRALAPSDRLYNPLLYAPSIFFRPPAFRLLSLLLSASSSSAGALGHLRTLVADSDALYGVRCTSTQPVHSYHLEGTALVKAPTPPRLATLGPRTSPTHPVPVNNTATVTVPCCNFVHTYRGSSSLARRTALHINCQWCFIRGEQQRARGSPEPPVSTAFGLSGDGRSCSNL